MLATFRINIFFISSFYDLFILTTTSIVDFEAHCVILLMMFVMVILFGSFYYLSCVLYFLHYDMFLYCDIYLYFLSLYINRPVTSPGFDWRLQVLAPISSSPVFILFFPGFSHFYLKYTFF